MDGTHHASEIRRFPLSAIISGVLGDGEARVSELW